MRNDKKITTLTEYQIRQWERAQEEAWAREAEVERQRRLDLHPKDCRCDDHSIIPGGYM